jgi:hypothetical protein
MEQHTESTISLLPNTNVIERHSVVKGTRDNYTSKLTDFIRWLWDNGRRDVLSHQCANKLMIAQRNDSRSTQSLGYQKNINRVIRQCIARIKRKDSESSPIRLLPTVENGESNERVLTYDDICDFMMTKHKIVKVDKALALEFKDALARSDGNEDENAEDDDSDADEQQEEQDLILNEDEVDEDGQVNVMIRLEASTYEGIRSAIAFLYRESGVPMPENMNSSLALYIKGSRRMNRLAKQTLGLKIVEGKKHMTLSVYKTIASILFESCELEHIFAHLFFVLDW